MKRWIYIYVWYDIVFVNKMLVYDVYLIWNDNINIILMWILNN
jgi:hypothetical protein